MAERSADWLVCRLTNRHQSFATLKLYSAFTRNPERQQQQSADDSNGVSRMAVVTELQAELLAALLNSGVNSETIIQALKAGERQTRPESNSAKLEKLVNGTSEEHPSMNSFACTTGIRSTDGRDETAATTMADLETNGQSIADQLMRNDPWQSAKIIKQYMQQHNIPQREAVETTGLNQSHLSQHLNKGTPMKTQKRMTLYKWFEAKQREVAAQYNSNSGKRLAEHDITSPLFTGTSSYKRARRNRFKWGQASTEILYQAYESQRNPSKDEREALVEACNRAECEQRGIPLEQVNNLGPNLVTESRVYNWFANRRKEEAFKVKLALDAGTYPAPILGAAGAEMFSTPESKLITATSEKMTLLSKSPLPSLSSHPLTKLSNSLQTAGDLGSRTPVPTTRLPTMSLIKCEQSPTTSLTQTPALPYAHHVSQNTPGVLPRPISVAFGAVPPQILTPTQLQVITGLMPGQMVPISHAASGLVGQSTEISTAAALPPGHITNLMLPGQLGGQPIPMHAVTLMSVAGDTSQVFYSMPSHSPVVSVAMPTAVTSSSTQFPISSHLSVAGTAGATAADLSTTSPVQIAANESTIQRQSQILPHISAIHGAGSAQAHLVAGANGSALPNQVYSQMILPVASPLHAQAQTPHTTVVRPCLTTKTDVSRILPVSRVQLPSISQLGTPSPIRNPTSAVPGERVLGQLRPAAGEGIKRLGNLSAGNTLVVEMKPVEHAEKIAELDGSVGGKKVGGSEGGRASAEAVAVTLVPETGDKADGKSFKEPTLTLSEVGVVALGNGEGSGGEVNAPTAVQTVPNVQVVVEGKV